MTRLNAREQRLAALFVLLLAGALTWALAIRPLASGFADRAARRDLLLATYTRDEQLIGQLPSMARAAAAQRRDAGRYRLATADESAATAVTVERLGRTVAAVGGQLGAVENLAGAPGVVRARVDCRLSQPQLAAFLERLRNDAPYAMVDALQINAIDDGEVSSVGLLGVRAEVSIFYPGAAPR